MTERHAYEGMLGIARYNWPYYAGAVITLIIGGTALWLPLPFCLAGGVAVLGSLWFLVGSLLVSHWVYDRSPLYGWQWLKTILEKDAPQEALICVAGFDDVSAGLKAALPDMRFQLLDHYDPQHMTEASIHRARRAHPPGEDSLQAPFDVWPPLQADLVLAPMSIHEFRSVDERAAWFCQAHKALRAGGKILLIEHLRDPANFVAFGPGFLHFHSWRSWRQSWEAAGLSLVEHFPLTPFLRVFIVQ